MGEPMRHQNKQSAPCPKCGKPMPASYVAKGYQCNRCADAEES